MFSHRLSWSFEPNPLARRIEEKRRTGATILDLTESNPSRAELREERHASRDLLAPLGDRRALDYDPSPTGLREAREAVARYYMERRREVDPGHLMLTASTSEAYSFVFKLLADPGDHLLIPQPSYPLFDYLARMEGLEVGSYPLHYDDGSWHIDLQALRESTTPRTRAVVLVHPNNPTGSYVRRNERDAIADVCRERDMAMIIDEVFLDYSLTAPNQEAAPATTFVGCDDVLTFVLSGLSKIAALPQMKLAWIWTGGPENRAIRARERLEQIGDVYLSVATPVQLASRRWLELAASIQKAIRERLRLNQRVLSQELSACPPADGLAIEGGWYAVLRLPNIQSSERWALELLSSDDVLVHPGYLFDFSVESHLVVSLPTSTSTFGEGIRRLTSRVRDACR